MKKFSIFLLIISILCACTPKKIEEPKEPFTVTYFYAKSCAVCKKLKESFIPKLTEEFGDQITIVAYDIDDEGIVDLYDSYIGLYDSEKEIWDLEGKLEGVSEQIASYERLVPLVVVDDDYAFLGYTNDLINAYIQDMHLMLKGRKLATGDVSNDRWYFKESE